MLDRKLIVDNGTSIKENCRRRGANVDVDRLIDLETSRRSKLRELEELNRRSNDVAKAIAQAKTPDEREQRKTEGRELRERREALQKEHDGLDAEVLGLQLRVPNLTHPAAPIGEDDRSNAELRQGRHPVPKLGFKPLDHVALGERLGLIDFEGGARTTGAGFYFLKNEAVLLELALQQYALGELVRRGYTPVITPDLAQDSILEGIGFMPRGPETQVYSIENSNLSLVGTAEITLGGLYAAQTIPAEELPIRLCGISHCYRTEAGAAGRASRGLYRVHQFTKIEMFAFTLPDASDAMHEELVGIEQSLFDGLGIAYRVVDTATGDLGGPAYRKFDLEAWMPGRGEGGEYGEVTSTSNCTDYQSRRLNIRFKRAGEKGTELVHTLNGTAIAVSRALVAILENYQNQDGSVTVPEALRPWVGKERIAR